MLNKTTFWELLTNYKIDIALIERDYAFGHKRVAYQREQFLNKIHTHLSGNNELHLDYVYGRVEGNTLTPIDGKQKLVTLFLLHWYIMVKEDVGFDKREMLKRFQLGHNTHTQQFCNALATQEITLPPYTQYGELTAFIKNKYWYKNVWNKQPSTQSMLEVMESIHQKLFKTKRKSLWESLTQDNIISFDMLNMAEKGFKQIDQPYIKMHLRGKPLSRFDKFKPRFLQLIADQHGDKKLKHPTKGKVSFATYFSYKIEQEWTDLFWVFREDKATIDDNFFDYFRYITRLLFLKENKNSSKANFTNSYDQYKEVYANAENLVLLADSLNSLYELAVTQGQTDVESLNSFLNSLPRKMGLTQHGEIVDVGLYLEK